MRRYRLLSVDNALIAGLLALVLVMLAAVVALVIQDSHNRDVCAKSGMVYLSHDKVCLPGILP